MKTIVSLLLAVCLVSCSQPKPQPEAQTPVKYQPLDLTSEPSTVPAPEAGAPAATSSTTVTKTETQPAATMEPGTKTTTVTKETTVTAGAPAADQMAPPGSAPTTAAVAQPTAPGAPTSPFGRPPQPTIPAITTPPPTAPGNVPGGVMPGGTTITPSAASNTNETLIPEMSINFHAQPIDGVLQTYADFVHKILLRSPNIQPTATITFVQQIPLTKTEMIHALDAVLLMNNVAMIPIGDKFIKVVPITEAGNNGGSVSDMNASTLPIFGPFDTHIVQLHYTKPSEMVQVLQSFTKTPAAVLPIEGSGMLVLRDTAENVRVMLDMINRLDTSVPSEIESEVIPIKYALASDIADALNSISGGGGGGTSFGGRSGTGSTGSLGTSRSVGQGNARGGVGGSSVRRLWRRRYQFAGGISGGSLGRGAGLGRSGGNGGSAGGG